MGGEVLGAEAEIQQRVHVAIRQQDHAAAIAAVTAVGAAVDDKLFAVEGTAAVAAVARLGGKRRFIYKQCHEIDLSLFCFAGSQPLAAPQHQDTRDGGDHTHQVNLAKAGEHAADGAQHKAKDSRVGGYGEFSQQEFD